MKKWNLYFVMLCLIPAAINAQRKTLVRPSISDVTGLEHLPANKNDCPGGKCPTGMSCDGDCCMYPTNETIGQLNYIIYNKCDAIKDLHMRFEVTKELTADYDELTTNCDASKITKKLNSTEGIVIQFNCFSKDAPKALIQYIFDVSGTSITPHIQYAGGTPDKVDHDWVQSYTNAFGLTLSKANSLAKGYILEVELSTDSKGYVDGATFTVTEPGGKKETQKAAKSGLFPLRISEFQTNIVSTNGHYVHFAKGGEGTLSYSSSGEMCVEGGNYEHCATALGDYNGGTCETSNASYGKLSSCCTKEGESFKQSVTIK
ncbi:MAG TPA: hypothetical protein VG052_11335 [Puia sp.]|jgi:hypothetical protein|nr:hypothetical protein [Puia sp.]